MTLLLTRSQVRRIDQLAIERFGMTGLVLMENAGRGVFDVIRAQEPTGPVAVCCGKGNNAGDGFVIARHLDNHGVPVKVLLWNDPEDLRGDAAANYRILTTTDVPIVRFEGPATEWQDRLDAELAGTTWIVDALLGTGALGEPRPPLDDVIEQLNRHQAKRLAIDLPSGLDCDTGTPARHTFRANVTCTFVAAKPGLVAPAAADYVGEIHVVDIGVPRKAVEQIAAEGS